MTTAMPDLFAGALNDLANGPRITDFDALTKALMARMAEKGATLEQLTGPRFLGKPISKLRAYCNRFDLRFPNYTPPQLRKVVTYSLRAGVATFTGDHIERVAEIVGATVEASALSVPVQTLNAHKELIQHLGFAPKRVKAEKLNG